MAEKLDWQAETLRVTAFPLSPLEVEHLDWWHTVTGEKPEGRTLQPRTEQLQESGVINDGRFLLNLSCASDRVDWVIGSPPPNEGLTGKLPTCGSFFDSVEVLRNIVATWLPHAPALRRVAFGAVLLAEVQDVRSGYIELGGYLPAIKLDPDSSEFNYSINRPRKTLSDTIPIRVNRISRWSVAKLMPFRIELSEKQVVSLPSSQGWVACRLELDINTDAEYPNELPKDQLAALLDGLISLGGEITEKGDVP